MSDFFNFDALDMAANEKIAATATHPLKDKLNIQLKFAYIGGLVFAAFADDGALQDAELGAVNCVALSLGCSQENVDEVVEQVKSVPDKISYLKELLALLKDREHILYYLVDMQKVMGMDGAIDENGHKLLTACCKLSQVPDDDVAFVRDLGCVCAKKSGWTRDELTRIKVGGDEIRKQIYDWFCSEEIVEATRHAAEEARLEAENNLKQASLELARSRLDLVVSTTVCPLVGETRVYYCSDIPISKYYKARQTMRIQEQEHFIQVDMTLFGSGADGIVVTNRAVYVKELFTDVVRIPFKQLASCTYSGSKVIFNGGVSIQLTMVDTAMIPKFVGVINELISKFKEDPSLLDV